MKRISMKMTKEEMFTALQTLKPLHKKHVVTNIEDAINRAFEIIPDNEVEYAVFVILNPYGLQIGTFSFSTAKRVSEILCKWHFPFILHSRLTYQET
jgi:hypothetical protein